MEEYTNPNNVVVMQQPAMPNHDEEEESLSIVNIIMRCLSNWYWFVICIIISLSFAFLHVKKQEPVYTRAATVLIKEEANMSSSNKLGVQEDMGVFKSTSTVANEMIAMQSPQVVSEVVRRLKLYMNYSTEGRFHRVTMYGEICPIEVIMEDVNEDQWANLTVELANEGEVVLKDFSKGQPNTVITGKMNERISTPLGTVQVLPTKSYYGQRTEIYVNHWSIEASTGRYQGGLVMDRRERTSVIDLAFSDVSTQRAEDFLSMLIQVYSEFWVNDRNQIALSTNRFITERLSVIEKELGNVDSDISSYKSQNLIPNLEASTSRNMGEAASASQQIVDLNTEISITKYLLDYVKNKKNFNKLIPSISDVGTVSGLISNFNEKILERNSLVASSSETNPLVLEMDEQLANIYDVILSSLENQLVALNTQLKSTQSTESKATTKMANNPEQAKYLLSIERQQAVKQALYTYLLQKREENELSQAFTAYNTRLLNPPSGGSAPTAPKSQMIYLIALAIGVAIPLAFIILFEIMNTTVRGRKDLENLSSPFLGEIPFVQADKRNFWSRLIGAKNIKQFIKSEPIVMRVLMKLGIWKKSDRQSDKNLKLYVKNGSRNQINEAFRVVRSNMEFMKSDKPSQIEMITSANAGSGKTFVTINLGASFAVKGKKVLAIDMDFRKRSLSKYVNKPAKGLVDYLANKVDCYDNLIVKGSLIENLDVLPVGAIPPNPTELLYEERLGEMLQDLRERYDLILLDCPPIEIVADASIVAKYADKTIFIVRAGLLQRNMLPEIDKFYMSKKFGNISILLNGTDDSYGKYGYFKYGYRYGYHYGYGSHYGSES